MESHVPTFIVMLFIYINIKIMSQLGVHIGARIYACPSLGPVLPFALCCMACSSVGFLLLKAAYRSSSLIMTLFEFRFAGVFGESCRSM